MQKTAATAETQQAPLDHDTSLTTPTASCPTCISGIDATTLEPDLLDILKR